ncbi:MAG: hypothetical protein J6R33_03290, partial [Clostridia bacterium]|nr:hypothetical protein [Clostridia bacterium]
YTGVNVADVRARMAQYPDKKVVLCAHWFDMEKESGEFCSLLANEERIVCLFCGHNHLSAILSTGEACGNKPIICCGHYSYSGEKNPLLCMGGYREVCISEKGLTSRYMMPPHTYRMKKVTFTTEYAQQDEIEIAF